MKLLSLFFIGLGLCFSTHLVAKEDIPFFAKIVAQNDGDIYPDDSTLVSVYLYATAPIGDILIKGKQPTMSGCQVRCLYLNKGQQQSITRMNGKAYYTVLCAQYAVKGENKGKYNFPKLHIEANLYKEETNKSSQRTDPFFGPFSSFFDRPTYKKEKVSTRSDALKMQVVTAPHKTAEQLKKMGKVII